MSTINAYLEELEAQLRGHDGGDAVDEPRCGDGGEDDQPEPDEDVDLLVDDVYRQDAHRVVGLHRARRAEFPKGEVWRVRNILGSGHEESTVFSPTIPDFLDILAA